MKSYCFESDFVPWTWLPSEGNPESPPCFLGYSEQQNNLRYADDTTLMAEREEELKSLLMKVKEEREKAGLKLTI